SAGAMPSMLAAFAAREAGTPLELGAPATYFAPVAALAEALRLPSAPCHQLLGACASSTLAIGLGARWVDAGYADLVIAGGYDAVNPLVALGFEALGALTGDVPRPFRAVRDGMALGEGAGLVALAPASPERVARGHVLGFGASSDAVHVTAPDRSGAGLVRAARHALADAALGSADIDLVNAHATATPYNDAAEARALATLFGARPVPVHAFKAVVGHTLGAAGVLETLAALSALEQGVVPGTPGDGPLEPEFKNALPTEARAGRPRAALKWSAAFGGLDVALVLGGPEWGEGPGRRQRVPVALTAVSGAVSAEELESVQRVARRPEVVERADPVSALVLTATARLLASSGVALGPETAVVVGTASATLEVDERFDRRRRAGRPVEPRRFPATSPNLSAGLCSIAFGLHGPALSVGTGPGASWEALLVAHDLVACGDVERALVVAVEDVGPVVADVFTAAGLPIPSRGARAVLLESGSGGTLLERQVIAERASGPCSAEWPFA
ncbi:MAG: beta-ketoacyl synthase N-terminal-like domain-containing protein, partial [Pseudomonadota bacterium]